MSLGEWTLLREAVDVEEYRHGRLGPYRVGRAVRPTRHGEILLAITDEEPRVVELELLAPERVAEAEQAVLKSIDRVLGLEHRHLAPLTGAGLHEGIVYLARPHRLGRSLADVMDETGGAAELAPGLAYALAQVVDFLADAGPHPGSCSAGGFEAEDVELGFDGGLRMRTGTQALRDADEPAAADRRSLSELVAAVGAWAGWSGAPPSPGEELQTWCRRLRAESREACAERRTLLGAHLRRCYAEDLRVERARFGLSTLQ